MYSKYLFFMCLAAIAAVTRVTIRRVSPTSSTANASDIYGLTHVWKPDYRPNAGADRLRRNHYHAPYLANRPPWVRPRRVSMLNPTDGAYSQNLM